VYDFQRFKKHVAHVEFADEVALSEQKVSQLGQSSSLQHDLRYSILPQFERLQLWKCDSPEAKLFEVVGIYTIFFQYPG